MAVLYFFFFVAVLGCTIILRTVVRKSAIDSLGEISSASEISFFQLAVAYWVHLKTKCQNDVQALSLFAEWIDATLDGGDLED